MSVSHCVLRWLYYSSMDFVVTYKTTISKGTQRLSEKWPCYVWSGT